MGGWLCSTEPAPSRESTWVRPLTSCWGSELGACHPVVMDERHSHWLMELRLWWEGPTHSVDKM